MASSDMKITKISRDGGIGIQAYNEFTKALFSRIKRKLQ
jgi:hypothetical protein